MFRAIIYVKKIFYSPCSIAAAPTASAFSALAEMFDNKQV